MLFSLVAYIARYVEKALNADRSCWNGKDVSNPAAQLRPLKFLASPIVKDIAN